MKKIKLLLILGISLLALSPMIVTANENDETELVCFYRKNCEGELEYICTDPNSIEPQQSVCPPGCINPQE